MKRKVILLSYLLGCVLFAVLTFAAVRYVCFDRPRPETEETRQALLVSPEDRAAEEALRKTETQPPEAPVTETPEAPETVPASPAEDPLPELRFCTGNRVNIRTGPGTSYPVIGHMNRGESIQALPEAGSWTRVIYGDRTAYIHSRYLRERAPEKDSRELPDTGDPSRRAPVRTAEKPMTNAGEALYAPADETVFCQGDTVNIRASAGLSSPILGQLHWGESIHRSGIGSNGWSRVSFGAGEGYMVSRLLTDNLTREEEESSGFEAPTPNAPFLYQYCSAPGSMPYGLFLPADYDGSRALPLIISLHGAGERGKDRAYFESKFLVHAFLNWEYSGLEPFDAIILCPHLTGSGWSRSWNNTASADRVFALIDRIVETYAVDSSRIILQGQSMGAQGCLYLAADSRARFSAVVPISAYPPGRDYTGISVPVRGYSGSPFQPRPREDWDSYNFMEAAFTQVFGKENWFLRNCSHDEIPLVAFREDQDGDGRSDLIDWMLSQ